MLQNPKLPERLRTPDGWPEAMRAEWGNDEGKSSAARHRETLVGWLGKTRAALDAFKPDFVLMWGDDQYENFKEDVVPPYCIAAYDRFKFATPPGNVWGETDKVYDLPGHPKAAKMLATRLIEEGFDTPTPTSRCTIGSATPSPTRSCISTTRAPGFDYPIVPFAINCYGRKVLRSAAACRCSIRRDRRGQSSIRRAPTPRRLFDMGAATARVLAGVAYRVALRARQGWSHAVPDGKNISCGPTRRPTAHVRGAARLATGRPWRGYDGRGGRGRGQQEILNWAGLAGAHQRAEAQAPGGRASSHLDLNSPRVS
jgi:hypothetical protein